MRRGIEPDRVQHTIDFLLAQDTVALAGNQHRLVENAPDAPPWIERSAGVLVHVLNLAPKGAGAKRRLAAHAPAFQQDLAARFALNAEQGSGERRLPAPGFAHEAE